MGSTNEGGVTQIRIVDEKLLRTRVQIPSHKQHDISNRHGIVEVQGHLDWQYRSNMPFNFLQRGSKNQKESKVVTQVITGNEVEVSVDIDIDVTYCNKHDAE